MGTNVYAVRDRKTNQVVALVRAGNNTQVYRHMAQQTFEVKLADQDTLIATAARLKVQVAGAEQEPEPERDPNTRELPGLDPEQAARAREAIDRMPSPPALATA